MLDTDRGSFTRGRSLAAIRSASLSSSALGAPRIPAILSWALFALGVTHIAYGFVKFKVPLSEAAAAGIIGQFKVPEIRRTAFWFLMCGPLLILSGHVAIYAVAVSDFALLRIVGIYTLVSSVAGLVAFPNSPFWASLLLAPLLIAAGYGLVA